MTILNGNGPIGEAAGTPIPDFQEFNMFSKRCGILIDGIYTEPQTGQDKITFECSCLNKGNQDIVWGFVLLEHRTTPPTPKPKESPPPVQRPVTRRVKVAMRHPTVSSDADFASNTSIWPRPNSPFGVSWEFLDSYDSHIPPWMPDNFDPAVLEWSPSSWQSLPALQGLPQHQQPLNDPCSFLRYLLHRPDSLNPLSNPRTRTQQ